MDSTATIYFSAIGICFLGSFFFAMSETALTSLTPVQAERLAEANGWFKQSLRYWIKIPNRILAAILVGNTVANTAAATLLTAYLTLHNPSLSVGVVTLGLSFMILVFGEIGPKMLARAYNEQISPFSCRILLFFNYIFYPLTFAITKTLSWILNTFGLVTSKSRAVKPEDIEHMVSMAKSQGVMETEKSEILSSIFAFSKRRVKDIMIARDKISAIPIDSSLLNVLDIIRQDNHSRYPVYNGDLERIVGFFHSRDIFGILRSLGLAEGNKENLGKFSLRTCLRRAFFVSEQSMISRVLNDMKTYRIHLAIVKDEWGNVVGLVTLEDILEEVFGEIEDEHDEQKEKPVVDLYGAGVEVEGSENIVDLKSKYGIEIEESDSYSTLNGFLQHYASHQHLTPKTVIIWENYVFSILNVKEGEIEKLRITEIPEREED
jgi:CBS domain containing-hemolysin-like protein